MYSCNYLRVHLHELTGARMHARTRTRGHVVYTQTSPDQFQCLMTSTANDQSQRVCIVTADLLQVVT